MRYILSEAILNVRHGGIVSVLAMFIVALTTILFGVLYLVRAAVHFELARMEDRPAVVVFATDGLTDDEVRALATDVEARPMVVSTRIVSKAEALARSHDLFGEQSAVLLEGFGQDNPLPRSIEIHTSDESGADGVLAALANELRGMAGVESVTFEADSIRAIGRVKNTVVLLGALVIAISVVVISFSIMLTIYARRDELNILRLVGATYAFIRAPLLLQGCIEGLVGSAVGLSLLYVLFRNLGAMAGVHDFLGPVAAASILSGATLIGLVGGMIPMRRRLKAVT
jgi:cell division transport system permease protein